MITSVDFSLAEVTTQDKLIHQGVFSNPGKPGKKALLWVHGLSSAFYSHIELLNEFARQSKVNGFCFAAFNNRGHDAISGARKLDTRKVKGYSHVNAGAGYESFAESVFDIEAGMKFLTKQGFSQIVLIGHSTGANKVCYFAATRKTPHVGAIILASPLSDRLDTVLDQEKLQKDLEHMQNLVRQGRGDELQLGYHYFPMTPKRFVSLFSKDSLEDQFDYGDSKPKLKYFSKIKLPTLIILGSADEYLDRPAEKVVEVFDAKALSKNYKSIILPDVLHGYQGSEILVVKTICFWIAGI